MTLENKNNCQFYPSVNHASYNNNLLTNISIGAMATKNDMGVTNYNLLGLNTYSMRGNA